eukprot:TRINITY_DN1165_c0_g2_i1.p1 TRINITY_DN1165_c0_g2~~TRINITY_DN1165_c0_g2_i1.p1  ORF type:complete len:225 (+),score=75.11 TRINITY_DN1165_c0_g2_i1:40-714(+)
MIVVQSNGSLFEFEDGIALSSLQKQLEQSTQVSIKNQLLLVWKSSNETVMGMSKGIMNEEETSMGSSSSSSSSSSSTSTSIDSLSPSEIMAGRVVVVNKEDAWNLDGRDNSVMFLYDMRNLCDVDAGNEEGEAEEGDIGRRMARMRAAVCVALMSSFDVFQSVENAHFGIHKEADKYLWEWKSIVDKFPDQMERLEAIQLLNRLREEGEFVEFWGKSLVEQSID